MSKIMFKFVIVIAMSIVTPLHAFNKKCKVTAKECRKTLSDLCIDPDIKSVTGWRRVCNNNKLILYMCSDKKVVSKVETDEACFCLENKEDINKNNFYIFDKGFE